MTGVSPAAVLWAAEQTVRQHEEPPNDARATGRCARCEDSGCGLLAWARVVLAADRNQVAMVAAG
ncbi:hypothetical protein [Catenuloplanes atrovinosus]|uniref:Uncharacterized protein n=1 Tax=Catenuloplanes atrovinosus TaxID=137266 RepID=A0AAE3YV20_9ACTN|nr:hypothetical protein [Catenuloplanes atrovinosus]MDR7278949.1 hypothetical protein [Catenuloplanes atrovinosus]